MGDLLQPWHILLLLIVAGVPLAIILLVVRSSRGRTTSQPPPSYMPQAKFCMNCGKQIPQATPYCGFCGSRAE